MDSGKNQRGVKPNSGHHDNSDEILAGIRHTRSRMDHTLDELGDKMQPRHLMEEAVDYFWTKERHTGEKAKQSAIKMGRKVVDEVREHPLPSLLIGAGIIWLLSQQRQRSREEVSETRESGAMESVKQRVSEGAGAVKEKASELAETAKEKMGEAKEKLGGAMESVREKGAQAKEKTKEYYQRTADTVRQTSEEHPLALGLACLAGGVLAGVMAPRTRIEDQMMGDVADRVREQGKQKAEEVAQKGERVAERAVEAGKQEARQQDLTPEGLSGESEVVKTTGEYPGPGPAI